MNLDIFLILLIFGLFFVLFPLLILQACLAIINNDQNLVSSNSTVEYINSKLLKKKISEDSNPFGIMAYSSPALLPLAFIPSNEDKYVLKFEDGVKCVVNKKQYEQVVEGKSYTLRKNIENKQYKFKWYTKPLLIKWFLSIEPNENETVVRFSLE